MWRWIVGSFLFLVASDAGFAQAPPRHPFIDSHVHLNDPAMQRSLMTEYGIARAVIFWGRNGTRCRS